MAVKKKCAAERRNGKCLLYKKTHQSKKAAQGHATNIKKRGGKVKITSKGATHVVEYSFPKK